MKAPPPTNPPRPRLTPKERELQAFNMKNTMEKHWGHLEAMTTWGAAKAFAEGRALYQAKIKRESPNSKIVRHGKARNAFGSLEWGACTHFDQLVALPQLVMRLAMSYVEIESAYYKGEKARKRRLRAEAGDVTDAQNRYLRQLQERDQVITSLKAQLSEAQESLDTVQSALTMAESQFEQKKNSKPKRRRVDPHDVQEA